MDEGVKNGIFHLDKQSYTLDEEKNKTAVKRAEKEPTRRSERISDKEKGIEPEGPMRYEDPEQSRKRKRSGSKSPTKKAEAKKKAPAKKKASPKKGKKAAKKEEKKEEHKDEEEEEHEEAKESPKKKSKKADEAK